MYNYLKSFIYTSAEKVDVSMALLNVLWYSRRHSKNIALIDKLSQLDVTVPEKLLNCLNDSKINAGTYKIIKHLLVKYNGPRWNVCEKIATMLTAEQPGVAAACAIAIGTEKVKWNKEFYHKVRVCKNMDLKDWRYFLNDMRKLEIYATLQSEPAKENILCLFNEPLYKSVVNPCSTVPIISLYKNNFSKNKHCRTSIELPLDSELTQKDLDKFVKECYSHSSEKDIVIVAKNVGKIVVPKNVYIFFIDNTCTYSEGVYPFVDNTEYSCIDNVYKII